MRSPRKLAVVMIISSVLMSIFPSGGVFAASSATLTFDFVSDPGDVADGPDFDVVGTGLVDDGSGCDAVVAIIVDATGTYTDIDSFCLSLVGGTGGSDGDYGAFGTGYVPTAGPATYAIFDITAADIATLAGMGVGDNDVAYGDYVVANGTFLTEGYVDVPGLTSGTPFSFVAAPPPTAAGPTVPGPDMVPISDAAVVGSFVTTTPIYYAPDDVAVTGTVMEGGKTAWVYGVDESGQFYKVMLSGRFFWVPVETMGPNFDDVWQGHPLPTEVVE